MFWQFTFYMIVTLGGTLLTLGIGVYAWQQRAVPGSRAWHVLDHAWEIEDRVA